MSTRDGAGGGDPQPVGFRSPGRARRQATPRLRGGGEAPGPQQPGPAPLPARGDQTPPGPADAVPCPASVPSLGRAGLSRAPARAVAPRVPRPGGAPSSRTLGTGRAGAALGFRPPGGIPGVGAREGDTWDNVPRTPRGSDTRTKGRGLRRLFGGCQQWPLDRPGQGLPPPLYCLWELGEQLWL